MSDMPETEGSAADKPAPKQLSKGQRRVLGVLIEKALTTPDQYPLTLKALTNGCNQKSNRDPISSYSEDSVTAYIDELRALGVVAVVHTESGRTERYRHYMRKRYPFSETQLAIITELLLRGGQQPGELRTRAGRMVPIDSQEQLRADLTALQELGYVQANGPLERRGVEVDHRFYLPNEGGRIEQPADEDEPVGEAPASRSIPPGALLSAAAPPSGRLDQLEALCADLRREKLEWSGEVESLKERVEELAHELAELRRALGA